MNPDHDVIVVGGGPAGSTAATLIARTPRRVLLLDRERFPRFRIGESLMPASYWTLKRLGLLGMLETSPYPRKHSVQFFSKSGRGSAPFYFSEIDSHESSATWQVDRVTFDRALLDNAREAGVEVREGANVKDVLFEDGRATGVVVELSDGSRQEIAARVIIDATGQTAMLGRKFKLKDVDSRLQHASLYTRFTGAKRDEGIDAGATLILRTAEDRSWFWFIPLPGEITSVGVVGPVDDLLGGRKGRPADVFAGQLEACPALQTRLAGAEQVGEVSAVRDFSYISRRIAGDGWVMAGDAFGFLDPIYSTGVFLALKSGEFAADAVIDAFDKQDFSAAILGQHGPRYLEAMESLRKLVYAFYDDSFSIAGFLKRNPEYREHVVNLLIGNVFRAPAEGLFEAMSHEVVLPEARRLLPDEKPR